MNKFDDLMKTFRSILLRITEVLGLFVALIVLIYLLLGEDSGQFVVGVVGNLALLITAITPQTLIAIALVLGLYLAIGARRPKD